MRKHTRKTFVNGWFYISPLSACLSGCLMKRCRKVLCSSSSSSSSSKVYSTLLQYHNYDESTKLHKMSRSTKRTLELFNQGAPYWRFSITRLTLNFVSAWCEHKCNI